MTPAELDARFGIPGVAQVVAGNGGLAKVRITAAAASGEIYLHGAHVTSWQPRGAEEVLFVSQKSRWDDGRAIRGGVPICFPWFADKADDRGAPAHGLVRTKAWQLESVVETGEGVTVGMITASDDDGRKWWPGDFELRYRATFGAQLDLELAVTNTAAMPLRFEEALHAYFRVGRIQQVRLHGLNEIQYLDKTDQNRKKTQQGPLVIAAETDRVYLNTKSAIELEDQALRRRIQIAKENSSTTVVWNPWIEKSAALADLGDSQWEQMVCVETSNVAEYAVELAPGRQHSLRAIVRVAEL